jgi:hypothetical protein
MPPAPVEVLVLVLVDVLVLDELAPPIPEDEDAVAVDVVPVVASLPPQLAEERATTPAPSAPNTIH